LRKTLSACRRFIITIGDDRAGIRLAESWHRINPRRTTGCFALFQTIATAILSNIIAALLHLKFAYTIVLLSSPLHFIILHTPISFDAGRVIPNQRDMSN